ncbi:MAG: hypothetical protein ACKO23_02375 [Gemmataceae bacterium]
MNSKATQTVLVLGDQRQALAVIRSLARIGYRVIFATSLKHSNVAKSRFIAETWHLNSAGVEKLRMELLERMAGRPDISLVFPIAEVDMQCLRQRDVPKPIRVISASEESAALCRDKTKLLAMAHERGVPVARWVKVRDSAALLDAVADIGFPLVLKPDVNAETDLGFKALILKSPAEALPEIKRFPQEGLIVQRHAEGFRHNVYFVAREGRLLGLGESRILRTDRLDGTGLAVEGITVSPSVALSRYTEQLVQAISYTGVGCAQFLLDERTGEVCFLEINPRLGANSNIICRAGMDLPRAFVDVVCGRDPSVGKWDIGRRYAWLSGDLNGFLDERSKMNLAAAFLWLGRLLRAQVRADDHVTWDWADPRPTLSMLRDRLARILRSPFRRSTVSLDKERS